MNPEDIKILQDKIKSNQLTSIDPGFVVFQTEKDPYYEILEKILEKLELIDEKLSPKVSKKPRPRAFRG